ncbi:MAG: hypothetical protein ACYTXA_07345 [Nostoc sp.]
MPLKQRYPPKLEPSKSLIEDIINLFGMIGGPFWMESFGQWAELGEANLPEQSVVNGSQIFTVCLLLP